MESATGLVYRDGAFVEGSVTLERGMCRVSDAPDPNAEVNGIILPRTVNCHTHLGDSFIQRPPAMSVRELVAPPDGLKHRMLREVSERVQVDSMREAMNRIASTGTSHFIDFREGGLEGARRLLAASLGTGACPVILGRPDGCDEMEVLALLSVADGFGLSAISDLEYDELCHLSQSARSQGKAFAMHASEAAREDMGRILDLRPDLLVHLVHATVEDLSECASAGVRAVVCPSSNTFFRMRAPVREMLDAGMTVSLGTDNAMLAPPDLLSEARMLRSAFTAGELTDREVMNIAFDNGRKVLNSLPGFGDGTGGQQEFFVLEVPAEDPFRAALQAGADRIRLFSRSEAA